MALQSIQLEHLPASHTLHVALYHNVKNAAFLHQQLLAGNTDFEYALIDASVIISKVHVLAAAYRAVNDLLENRLRSRNVHSEIVLSLSPNNNIAESFRRFGITPLTTNLLAIKVTAPSISASSFADIQQHLTDTIEGEAIEFSDEVIAGLTDIVRVKKIYKLSSGGQKKGAVDDMRELEISVLGAMALRGVTN